MLGEPEALYLVLALYSISFFYLEQNNGHFPPMPLVLDVDIGTITGLVGGLL